MEILMSLLIGFLFAAAVYLMLSKSLIRVVLGTAVLSHAAHLLLLTMGGLGGTKPPVVADGVTVYDYADPLPQALILTAIVIAFAVTAFLLVVSYRAYQELGTDDMSLMKGNEDE
ncbi:Na(+)/H(+) antiporter subunit C [Planomicrobium sp. YIM 101495]|uniref:Na(+)/H(+) antiporter subunit C n=1 Tax=Planomicrobium sp. YIM 101495 TaxID=2665160 RepID=UPI0012B6B5A3|nr:Na(+)/H(+) antiporter subunit C [Planomicrobium sp. YIM 101495]MTD31806.1 Na(+)/H(+) antiporter subunit C [Planomicrobium sp. YIM 101495]